MCGITGAVWTDPRLAINDDALARMTSILEHRGPDAEGVWRKNGSPSGRVGVALGHRRLAIIGLADGAQPMTNEDESLAVVFNGEIYNFRTLRSELEREGRSFRTSSDTESLLRLYESDGLDMFARLNGMFSFAIWDAARRRLVLARDRLGQKPLYYRHEAGRLIFASELKSLVEANDVPRRIDPISLRYYLTHQYVPHPRTIYEGVSKLPPGCFLVWQDGAISVKPYWTPDFQSETSCEPIRRSGVLARGPLHQRLDETLSDAVRLRLQSEVPLGAFLSGGVDSTIIVGLMREQSLGPVRTFSIASPVPEYDETDYALQAARHLGTEHEVFRVEPDALELLPKLVRHFDEPMADSSAIPTWYVSEMTRRHVTVSLTGDGGDELFAGYPRYRAVQLAAQFDRYPRFVRQFLGHPIWDHLPEPARRKSALTRLKLFLGGLRYDDPIERYQHYTATFRHADAESLLEPAFVREAEQQEPFDESAFLREAFARCDRRDPVTVACLTDLTTYLPCDLMPKVDIASMAHGLECRQPFLDHRVVELAASMPIDLKMRQGVGKRILTETFSRFLPESIQNRKKMGFGVPLDHWLRGPMSGFARELLTEKRTRERGMFRPEAVERLLNEHVRATRDNAYKIWTLLVLELWMREWIDG